MAVDPLQTVTSESSSPQVAPKMLRRPTDAPLPFEHIRASEHLRILHLGWARLNDHAQNTPATPTQWQRVSSKVRRTLPFGGADRELLGVLIRTVDAIALRCDEIADRLSVQESLMEDVTDSFGEDITHLRAELVQLRVALAASDPPVQ
jgi:hypothetical protein